MDIQRCVKESFSVIGKEGSTDNGEGFIQRLWAEANAHFAEAAPLAKRDAQGNILGIWGVMSDMSRSFLPWEDHFSKGLYLAGVEAAEDAQAPQGWVKWTVPSYEYLYAQRESPRSFEEVLDYMKTNGLTLAGAIHDFICPEDGLEDMFFPIKKMA